MEGHVPHAHACHRPAAPVMKSPQLAAHNSVVDRECTSVKTVVCEARCETDIITTSADNQSQRGSTYPQVSWFINTPFLEVDRSGS